MDEPSVKQIAANQENAKKGGVKTDEGKAISRYNALKHGLLSREVLLKGEDEDFFIAMQKRLRTELSPTTEMEQILVDRIAANVWRLRRALQVEREMIQDDQEGNEDFSFNRGKTMGSFFSRDFANHDTYGKFIRYESSIERGIYRALHELQRLQAARTGDITPLPPIAIDVNTDDAD